MKVVKKSSLSGLVVLVIRRDLLLSLLVLPLCIPVLIFGTGAVEAVSTGLSAASHLSLLGALLVFALVSTPWVTAQALRISME